jgi:hypothetical protein
MKLPSKFPTKCHCGAPGTRFYVNEKLRKNTGQWITRVMTRCEIHLIYTKKNRLPKEISEEEYYVWEIMTQ